MPYANNKGADQPAHPRSLIRAFVVRCLDYTSIITLVSISQITSFYGCTEGLCLNWSQTPKTGFLVMRLISFFQCWEDKKKMNKANAKSLATLRQKLKKYNRDFEEDIAKYRESPDLGEGEDEDEDDDSKDFQH